MPHTTDKIYLLHLTDDLTGLGQGLDHLQTFLSPPDRVVAFLEEIVEFAGAVHVLEELSLHLVFCESKWRVSTPGIGSVELYVYRVLTARE